MVLCDFFAKNSTYIVPQPEYSPDLAPCDTWLFDKFRKDNAEGYAEKTISGVFQTFSSEISNAPLVSSVHSFFDVGSFGGSCPVWSVDAWFFHIVIDQLCSSLVIHEVFPIVRAVIILVFSFSAFRVAFL